MKSCNIQEAGGIHGILVINSFRKRIDVAVNEKTILNTWFHYVLSMGEYF